MGRAAKRKGSEEMRLGAALDGKGKGKGKWERPGMGNSAGAPTLGRSAPVKVIAHSRALLGKARGPIRRATKPSGAGLRQAEGLLVNISHPRQRPGQ